MQALRGQKSVEEGKYVKKDVLRKVLTAFVAVLVAWVAVKFLLPVLLPFGIGTLLALAAEPVVAFFHKKGGLPRSVAAGVGVTTTLIFLLGVTSFVGALAVKEISQLAQALPDVEKTLHAGVQLLEEACLGFAGRLPTGIRPLAERTTRQLFSQGNTWMEATPRRLQTLLGRIPDSAVGVGTGLISGFMISGRLPQLKEKMVTWLPDAWRQTLKRLRTTLGGWLRAQLKLAMVTWGILTVGFLLVSVPYGPLWAVLVALVDAVPVLGTGAVLVPWALVCFLKRNSLTGVVLLGLCALTMVLRRILEPKLVGQQLGLDPLLTLMFLYAGYRFFGVIGMILAPLLAAAGKGLTVPGEG